jgi:hypothetical protein
MAISHVPISPISMYKYKQFDSIQIQYSASQIKNQVQRKATFSFSSTFFFFFLKEIVCFLRKQAEATVSLSSNSLGKKKTKQRVHQFNNLIDQRDTLRMQRREIERR